MLYLISSVVHGEGGNFFCLGLGVGIGCLGLVLCPDSLLASQPLSDERAPT